MKTTDCEMAPVPECPEEINAPAYCLGEMQDVERKAFARHLIECAVCAKAAESTARLVSNLRADPDTACSPDFAERVLARTAASEDDGGPLVLRIFVRPAWRFAFAAGIVLLLGVASLLLFKSARPPCPPPDGARGPVLACKHAQTWLRSVQQPDGGWEAVTQGSSTNYRIGVSSLALMALMREEAAPPGPTSESVRRGIEYLVASQDERGLFGPEFDGATYNQGMATLAMLNACDMWPEPSWRAAAERGVEFILSCQDGSGGWSYLRGGASSVNTSAGIWPLIALIRAKEMGLRGIETPLHDGLAWLRTAVAPDGQMGYHRVGESPYGFTTLTAAGAACLLQSGDDPSVRLAGKMLASVRDTASNSGGNRDFYELFFVSEALGRSTDQESRILLASLVTSLAGRQRQDGSQAGAWTPDDRWGPVGGPVYATAMAALSIRGS